MFNRRHLLYAATSAITIAAGFFRQIIPASAQQKNTNASNVSASSAHIFEFDGLKGKRIKLSEYQGKVVVVVNTASFCGFANQFKDLQSLWTRYKDSGLVIIGVPSNDFGGQEPGSADEISAFCSTEYGVSFPMAGKAVVKGENAHPFYKWAAKQNSTDVPKWNFFKYVLDKNGRIAGAFGTTTAPLDKSIVQLIDLKLAEQI